MAWKPIDIDHLPDGKMICGPIVRDVQNYDGKGASVSVWFVLTENYNCKLEVGRSPQKGDFDLILESETTPGLKVGEKLYVYLLTATSSTQSIALSNEIYAYKLYYNGTEFSLADLALGGRDLPSFTFPGGPIEDINIFHGSCRKPHGGDGQADALALLHEPLKKHIDTPKDRPQLLVLTGDQIYADDVADVLLYMIRAYIPILFGYNTLADHDKEFLGDEYENLKESMTPGNRNAKELLEKKVGFTGMLGTSLIMSLNEYKFEYTKSHLLSFEEYFLMYMFVWSDVLWNNISIGLSNSEEENTIDFLSNLSNAEDYITIVNRGSPVEITSLRHPHVKPFSTKETKGLVDLFSTLSTVRKVLANIAVYMMFDDHDVTDDWNLNKMWTKRITELGQNVIDNALCAYKICQGWGNSPELFSSSESLSDIKSKSIKFNYHKTFPLFEILFLDLRTGRGFAEINRSDSEPISDEKWIEKQKTNDLSPAALLSDTALEEQINQYFKKEYVFIVSGTPVIGVPKIEWVQKLGINRAKDREQGLYDKDAEAWSLNEEAITLFLMHIISKCDKIDGDKILNKIIFLSGDVHYSFAAKYQISSFSTKQNLVSSFYENHFDLVFIQLCSSSLKNYEFDSAGPSGPHNEGYDVMDGALAEILADAYQAVPDFEKYISGKWKDSFMMNREISHNNIGNIVDINEILELELELEHGYRYGGLSYALNLYREIINSGDYLWSVYQEFASNGNGRNGNSIVGHNNISRIKIIDSGRAIEQFSIWRKSPKTPSDGLAGTSLVLPLAHKERS